jgi:hypothetical protein
MVIWRVTEWVTLAETVRDPSKAFRSMYRSNLVRLRPCLCAKSLLINPFPVAPESTIPWAVASVAPCPSLAEIVIRCFQLFERLSSVRLTNSDIGRGPKTRLNSGTVLLIGRTLWMRQSWIGSCGHGGGCYDRWGNRYVRRQH